MKQGRVLSALIVFLLYAISASATPPACPSNVSPTPTSCYAYNELTGTTAFDAVGSNDGTFQGGYTLTGTGVQLNAASPSYISTASSLSNPFPVTVYADFVGTGGGLIQLANSSAPGASAQNYVFYLTSYGTVIFGAYNYGLLNTVQSIQPGYQVGGITGVSYADGNRHKAAASIGSSGMILYVDGVKVGSGNYTSAGGAPSGYWTFGTANTTAWPASPGLTSFNGTLYANAVWQGTQLTDAQALTLTGYVSPTPINIPLCQLSGEIGSLSNKFGLAYANQKITFTTNPGPQLPAGVGAQIVAPSSWSVTTDSLGNIPQPFYLPQGAHVMMTIGNGTIPARNIPLTIPLQTSTDLASLVLAEADPPQVVSEVAVAGPLFQGTTVQNPAPGQIGQATITTPNSQPITCATACTIPANTGPVQTATLTANSTVTMTGMLDGQQYFVDTVEGNGGGWTPTFAVNSPFTLVWDQGVSSQPAMASTSANSHQLWTFTVEGTVVVGSAGTIASSGGSGGLLLNGTLNFNNYSGINIGGLQLNKQSSPSSFAVTATCSGTCATTYTYEVTCVNDTGESTASAAVTSTNAASLSVSNFNALSWAAQPNCFGGYNVYGRIGGSLGLLSNVAVGTTTYQDTGAAQAGDSYTITFNSSAIPAVAVWDLKNALGASAGASPIDAFTANSGTGTTLTATGLTTTGNNETQIPAFSYSAVGGTFTPPGGFSNAIAVGASSTTNKGFYGATKNIAVAGAVGSTTASQSVSNVWSAMNIAVLPANSGTPITVGTTVSATASTPYKSVTFGNPTGTVSGDLEIICVAWSAGAGIQVPSSFVPIGSASTGTSGSPKTSCYYNYPQGTPAPPSANNTGILTQNTSAGQYKEVLLGLEQWTANSGNNPNGSSGAALASTSYPVPLTVQSCRASWAAMAGCSPFPVYAIKDTTAGVILCSSGTTSGSATDQAVTPTNYSIPANDVIAFLASTSGSSCTAGTTTLSILMHQ